MLHLFTEIESEVTKLGDAMKGVFSKVHATVSEAAEFSKEELQGGLADFLAGLNGVDFSISQAFEAGAKYAADKLKGVVAPVVPAVEPEPPVLTEVVSPGGVAPGVVVTAPAITINAPAVSLNAAAPAEVATAVAQAVAQAAPAGSPL